MALLSTLVKAVAEIEGLDETQVGWIARYLREAGLIAQAGRGRGAAKMSAYDAANLLIAVNASTSAKDAVHAVTKFSNTRLREDSILVTDAHLERNKSFFLKIRTSNQRGVRLNDFLANLIRAFHPDHASKLCDEDRILILVSFIRPSTECIIQISEVNELGVITQFSNTIFSVFEEIDRILSNEELISKYGNEYEFVPDKRDETTITRRTLAAVGNILTG